MKIFLNEWQTEQEMNWSVDRDRILQPQTEGCNMPDVDMELVVSEPYLQKTKCNPNKLWEHKKTCRWIRLMTQVTVFLRR